MVSSEKNKPLDIGSRIELFVDDFLIDKLEDTELLLHHPLPREIAMVWDKPWEGNVSCGLAVLHDEDRYRLYYRGSHVLEEGYRILHSVTCLAESDDAVNWERIPLGYITFDGSTDNNIASEDVFHPFLDTNSSPQVPGRYKSPAGEMDYGFYGLASTDGIQWKRVQEEPFFPDKYGYDWTQTAFWEPFRKKYFAYLRGWRKVGGGIVTQLKLTPPKKRWRDIRYCTSDDFLQWSDPVMVEFDPPLSHEEQFYTGNIQPCPRAPHILIGTPARYMPGRTKILDQPHNGLSDIAFISSRDGLHFKRWGEAFSRPGQDQKNWFTRNNFPIPVILQTSPEELSIYWSEHYHQDEPVRLRRGTIRTDGFVSIHAGYGGGEMVTKTLTFEGNRLIINYASSAFGEIQAEIQDEQGKGIDGFRLDQCPLIYGDEIEHTVTWEGGSDVKRLSGKPVRLRFRLRDADLYSLRFQE